jgi:hypothetical protein
MEKLKCKACGCESLRPMQVMVDPDSDTAELIGEEQESRFFNCQLCGDNWLTVKETTADGDCTIVFVHQMGTSPVLKRIAHMSTHVIVNDDTVDRWEYFLGEESVNEDEWRDTLTDRRETLRAVCVN